MMSLFICQCCGCIEDDSLIKKDYNSSKKHNVEFPNLSLAEMKGMGNSGVEVDLTIAYYHKWEKYLASIDYKQDTDIMMLCSRCNTGAWHGKFEWRSATDIEKEYAKYSKYNYCTYFDHPVSFETFEKLYNSDGYAHFREKLQAGFKKDKK
jgi:hypothetical protein